MSVPEYPDREQWPAYWRGIRRALVLLAVSAMAALVLFVALEPLRVRDEPWRLALVFAVTFVVAAVAERVVDWLARLWDSRVDAE